MNISKKIGIPIFILFHVLFVKMIMGQVYSGSSVNDSLYIKYSYIKNVEIEVNISKHYTWVYRDKINDSFGDIGGYALDGEYIEYRMPDMKIVRKGFFDLGLKTGTWKNWYTSGKIRRVANYNQGELHGTLCLYTKSGLLIKKSEFENGLLDGESIKMNINNNNDTIKTYLSYKKASKHGVYKKHLNSELVVKGRYKKGKKHGSFYYYDANGKLGKKVIYRKGKTIDRRFLGRLLNKIRIFTRRIFHNEESENKN